LRYVGPEIAYHLIWAIRADAGLVHSILNLNTVLSGQLGRPILEVPVWWGVTRLRVSRAFEPENVRLHPGVDPCPGATDARGPDGVLAVDCSRISTCARPLRSGSLKTRVAGLNSRDVA
jgi:hypothetical protein